MLQMRATAEPRVAAPPLHCFGSFLLDDPEEPKNQDQDQQATETDIHKFLPLVLSCSNGVGGRPFHSLRKRTDLLTV